MSDSPASIPITIGDKYFNSVDSACLAYEINRAVCWKEAKITGEPVLDIIKRECEAVERIKKMQQDFALGLYTRRKK